MITKKLFVILVFQFVLLGNVTAQHGDHTSEYAGQEQREIKSLSSGDIEELETGQGWGLAKAAELNGYPGPAHLLDMKEEIGLSDEQLQKVQNLYSNMKDRAIPLGKKLIYLEKKLDTAFANGSIDDKQLEDLLDQIGSVYATLRYVHLRTHLETMEILTDEQVASYNKLRGYSTGDPCDSVPEGHDPELWKKHNGCG